jgi:uncharacterized protein YciI
MITDGPTEDEARIVSEHFDYLEQLTKAGVVLLAGRTLNEDYSTFGIIIFRADSIAAARQIVEDDPAISQRVMRAELYPYRIALVGDLPPAKNGCRWAGSGRPLRACPACANN